MSLHPHGMRFSPFSPGKKNVILSVQQQPQQQTPNQQNVALKQYKNSATSTNIPVPTQNFFSRDAESLKNSKNPSFSDTDDDEQDYIEYESDANLSREDRYVLLQPRAEPQGQENLSNGTQSLKIFEKNSSSPPQKVLYSNASIDPNNPYLRYGNASINCHPSSDTRVHSESNASQRNSLILPQHSNRNSMDYPQSNRSSLDVSQSSYNTLIIHDNNETQPLFSAPLNPSGLNKNEMYFINSSPSPPNYGARKEKHISKSFVNYPSHTQGNDFTIMAPITENEQQYLNQSYVLKHLAKEVRMPNTQTIQETSENNSSSQNQNSAHDNAEVGKTRSKSQPDLSKFPDSNENQEIENFSTANILNSNDFELLEVENTKLREQLNDCLMKVAKSQKLEQEVTNIYRVHEELVQSCERRERLERTARNRLQSDCRRLQELNRTMRDQVEVLQQQLFAATQQQQQISSSGRTQQDLLVTQLIQENKELDEKNKRQHIEIQAQNATLEEQRIHISVLDSALKRLEEEVRQKNLYQKQLQTLLVANERRDKLRIELENELDMSPVTENLKWQLRDKDKQIMRLEAQRLNVEDQRNLKLQETDQNSDTMMSESLSAQRKVNELQSRLKIVENRLAEKEKEEIIRNLHEQKLYSGSIGNSYALLNNNDCYNTPSSSSIVSSAPTTPLICNPNNFDSLMPLANNSKTTSSASKTSFDALLAEAYRGLYQPNYSQNLPSVPPNSSGLSPNTSCSSSSTIKQRQTQQVSTTSSNPTHFIDYDQSLDEKRKSIDDQLKKLDNQLLTKICCFPSNFLGKKPVISEEMLMLTSNNSDVFLQNLAHLRNKRDITPKTSNSGKNEDIVLLEKQGRSSQKLRSNLAQISSTIGQNIDDISNICQSSKLPNNVPPPTKERQSSAPPSALPRPPRTLKPPRKIEYGRLSETPDQGKPNKKIHYEAKTSSLKRNQSPVTMTGSKNFVDIKNELQMGLSSTKNHLRTYGTMKADTANNITKIYYSNKPEYVSSKNYQRLPDSPSSSDSLKRFVNSSGSSCKKVSRPGGQPREGSLSSGSNSRQSPKPPDVAYTLLAISRTPPKYLNLNPNAKINHLSSSNNNSPTKPTLPSSSVLYQHSQAQNPEWKQQHQRANSGRSNSESGGENKYRIQF